MKNIFKIIISVAVIGTASAMEDSSALSMEASVNRKITAVESEVADLNAEWYEIKNSIDEKLLKYNHYCADISSILSSLIPPDNIAGQPRTTVTSLQRVSMYEMEKRDSISLFHRPEWMQQYKQTNFDAAVATLKRMRTKYLKQGISALDLNTDSYVNGFIFDGKLYSYSLATFCIINIDESESINESLELRNFLGNIKGNNKVYNLLITDDDTDLAEIYDSGTFSHIDSAISEESIEIKLPVLADGKKYGGRLLKVSDITRSYNFRMF